MFYCVLLIVYKLFLFIDILGGFSGGAIPVYILRFFIGQGNMFLVQKYLVINGDYMLIADLGIALGLVSLLQWIADGGGIYFLSKYEKEGKLLNKIGLLPFNEQKAGHQ